MGEDRSCALRFVVADRFLARPSQRSKAAGGSGGKGGGSGGGGSGGGGSGGGGVCFDFQKGRCARGDGCKYRHDEAAGMEAASGAGGAGAGGGGGGGGLVERGRSEVATVLENSAYLER